MEDEARLAGADECVGGQHGRGQGRNRRAQWIHLAADGQQRHVCGPDHPQDLADFQLREDDAGGLPG